MKKIFLTLLISLSPLISIHAEVPEILGIIYSDTVHTQFGAQIISLGDHNNDGYKEIITWGYNKKTYLFEGDTPLIQLQTLYSIVFHLL